jgi:hypothetical protein
MSSNQFTIYGSQSCVELHKFICSFYSLKTKAYDNSERNSIIISLLPILHCFSTFRIS